MAKKTSSAKKPAKKVAQSPRAQAKAASVKAGTSKQKPVKKKSALKKAVAPPVKAPPAKKPAAKLAVTKKPATKPAAKKSRPAKLAPTGYLTTLNHWRQSAVAGVRTIVQKPAATTLGLWQQVPAPRKLLEETGAKLRQVKLGRLKEAGKKELHELMHLAAAPRDRPHAATRQRPNQTQIAAKRK